MSSRFHILFRSIDSTPKEVKQVYKEIEKQNYSDYMLWNFDEKDVMEDTCYTKERFMSKVKSEDILCWITAGEEFAEGIFAYVNKLFEEKQDLCMIYGNEILNKDLGMTYLRDEIYKPSFSLPFLSNYNYIGDAVFVKASYIIENTKFLEKKDLESNYSILLSFHNQKEKCYHSPKIFIRDNFHFVRKNSQIVEHETQELHDFFGNKDIVLKERGNRYLLEKSCHDEKVSIITMIYAHNEPREYARTLINRTDYKNLEYIFIVKDSEKKQYLDDLDSRIHSYVCKKEIEDTECYIQASQIAQGNTYIFLREGIYPGQNDWVERLLDAQEIFNAGAVTPLVMKQNLTICEAGTAVNTNGIIHSVYENTVFSKVDDLFYNQYCLREQSAISGLAFCVKKENFLRVGGFDTKYHNVECMFADLGFKLRNEGMNCIYTPFSCVIDTNLSRKKIYFELLGKWDKYLTDDVFFNEKMVKKYFAPKAQYEMYTKKKVEKILWKKHVAIMMSGDESEDKKAAIHDFVRALPEKTYVCIFAYQNGKEMYQFTNQFTDVITDSKLLLGNNKNIALLRKFDTIYVLSNVYDNLIAELYPYEGKIIRNIAENVKKSNVEHTQVTYFGMKITNQIKVNPLVMNETIDIIVPIYNGYEYLERLFASIPRTNMKYRLIIVNDCSPDQRIKPFIEGVISHEKKVVYIEHAENVGFVRSVNDALSRVEGHVAIVNTDVELPEGWLERLMTPVVLQENIASSTPFTNSGSICSFPNLAMNNPIFMGRTVDEIDNIFRQLTPVYFEIPTGVGFCMGMNKHAIKEIGGLDAETFGKGYGEENDWCARARMHGYKNVHVNNLFVYHKHGGTFLPQEKQELLKKNLEILGQRYIFFHAEVAKFEQRDPYEKIRLYAALKVCMDIDAKTYLYFSHNWAGGAISYLNQQKRLITEVGDKYVGIYYDEPSKQFWIEFCYGEYQYTVKKIKAQDVFSIVRNIKADEIIISELISFPQLYDFLNCLVEVKKQKNTVLKVLMHDFYCICPSYTLVDSKFSFCGLPELSMCERCAQNNTNFKQLTRNIKEWRCEWGKLLRESDEVVCFSNDSKNHVIKAYPDVKVIVRPHKVERLPKVNKTEKKSERMNIGIIGAINEVKGIEIIKEMSQIARNKKKSIHFVIIGYTSENVQSENVIVTGRYKREELPDLIKKYDIDIVFIPSVWPETFSYTTQEAIMMGMPLAVFNIGAPVERVKQYNAGLVISEINAAKALKEIEAFLKRE